MCFDVIAIRFLEADRRFGRFLTFMSKYMRLFLNVDEHDMVYCMVVLVPPGLGFAAAIFC